MKTLVKNGKKYIVTDALYESLKKKSLFEADVTANPQTANNGQADVTANPTNKTVQKPQSNAKTGNINVTDKETLVNALNYVKDEMANNIIDFSKSKSAREAYGYGYEFFETLGKLMLKTSYNNDNVQERYILPDLLNKSPEEQKKILQNTIQEQVIKENINNAYNELSPKGSRFVINADNAIKDDMIKTVYMVSKNGSAILKSEGSMGRYNQLVKKQVTELINIGRKLNSKAEENNDDTDTNDIDLGKTVKEIFTKDDAIEAIANKAKELNITRKQNANKVIKSVIAEFMDEYIKKLESGEASVENVDRTNIINYLKMINNNSEEILKQMKEPEDKDAAMKKAIKQVKQYCDSQDDWSSTTVMMAVSKAAKDTGADYNKLKDFFDKLLNSKNELKQIESLYNEVSENTEVMNNRLKFKHEINDALYRIITNFYNVISGENILLSNYSTKYNEYVDKLLNVLTLVQQKQDEFFNTVKKISGAVTNADEIVSVINKINKSELGNTSDINKIFKSIIDNSSSIKEASQTITYSDFDDAERKLLDILNQNTPEELKNDEAIQVNDTNFEKKFNEIFNKGTIKNLLDSYDMCTKISLLGYFLVNSEQYLKGGNEKKEDDGDLSKALRIFRKYMGRTVNYDDMEEYEDTKKLMDRSLRASKAFATRVKNIYIRLNDVGIRWMRYNNKVYDRLDDFLKLSDDVKKVELLKKVYAYDAITKYYNTSNNHETEDNSNTSIDIINEIVPKNSDEQIKKEAIKKLNYKFLLPEYSQVQEIYTEILNDEELKSLVNIKQVFRQRWLKQYDRFLIVTDKDNNFICTLLLTKMFGTARAVADKLKGTKNPKNKVDNFFNSIKDKISVK